jgi:hypothetical protein
MVEQIPDVTNRWRMVVARPNHRRDLAMESEMAVEDHAKYLHFSVMDTDESTTDTDLIADAAQSWFAVHPT